MLVSLTGMKNTLIAALLLVGTPALIAAPIPEPNPEAETSAALALFERYKSMEGRWIGESTAGWENEVVYSVIARGSVVMAESNFAAHPGEKMVTMFHMHEGRLMLTHYCVAGNQPRLAATELTEDGRGATFTWLDGTGLGSRDEGHMDQAVIYFDEDGGYTSKWTWYQDGEESWMEEIRVERAP